MQMENNMRIENQRNLNNQRRDFSHSNITHGKTQVLNNHANGRDELNEFLKSNYKKFF